MDNSSSSLPTVPHSLHKAHSNQTSNGFSDTTTTATPNRKDSSHGKADSCLNCTDSPMDIATHYTSTTSTETSELDATVAATTVQENPHNNIAHHTQQRLNKDGLIDLKAGSGTPSVSKKQCDHFISPWSRNPSYQADTENPPSSSEVLDANCEKQFTAASSQVQPEPTTAVMHSPQQATQPPVRKLHPKLVHKSRSVIPT